MKGTFPWSLTRCTPHTTYIAHDPKLDFANWICESDDAKSALRGILDGNDATGGDNKTYIRRLAPVFDLKGEQVLPDRFSTLKGALVEVAATISHEIMATIEGSWIIFMLIYPILLFFKPRRHLCSLLWRKEDYTFLLVTSPKKNILNNGRTTWYV